MRAERVLHYPGSKWGLADWIINHMPPHLGYLEPCFGSGAVLFNKAPATVETINDIDNDITNLFNVIRSKPEELAHLIRWTPYSRTEYDNAYVISNDNDLERARKFLIRSWQSIRPKGYKSGWKCRSGSVDPYRVKQWNDLPDKLFAVADRLKQVQIENRSAVELIGSYNRAEVLIYCDPTYLNTKSRNYKHEMSWDDHYELLQSLKQHKGPVLLSAYPNSLYEDTLGDWEYDTQDQRIENGDIRKEILWLNPIAAEYNRQLTLF